MQEEFEEGTEINGYIFQQKLGSGGFSTVYSVLKKNCPTPFAAKVMTCNSTNISKSWESFDAEVYALMKLDHPNIIKMYDRFYVKNKFIIILQYCENSAERAGKMSNQRLIQVASQLISAVSYAHTQKVAHLDIKPPNVLFNEFGHVALVDFGISQIGQSLTKNNACTIAYAPPEIVNKSAGTPIDPFKADSWSVGITLLEFALGKYPLPLSNERELINSISAAKFSIPPSLPPALQSIIARCLIPNPSTRISMLQAEKEILASLKISGTYSIKTMTLNGKAIGQIIRERSSTNLIDADSSALHTNLFTSGMNTGTTGSAGSSKKFPVALTNMGTKVTYPGTNGLPTKKPISMSTTKMILSRSAMGGLTRQGASQTKFRATPITIPNVIH